MLHVLHLLVVRLAAAVHEALSPFMTEIREDLATVKNNMSFVKENLLRIESKIDSVSNNTVTTHLDICSWCF